MIAVFLNDQDAATHGSTAAIRNALFKSCNTDSPRLWLRRRMCWSQLSRDFWNGTPRYTIGLPRGTPLGRWVSAIELAWIFRRCGVRLAHIHWSGVDHWGFDLYRRIAPRLPYALTFHAFNRDRLRSQGLYEPDVVRRLLRGAFKITAVSRALKGDIGELLPSIDGKIKVVPNGVQINDEDDGLLPAGLPEKFILSAGIFCSVKGGDMLLLAIFDLWQEGRLKIPIVLCGQDEPKGQLARLVAALKLESAVILLPNCPHNIVIALMKRCLFFVSASREESFGIALLEAMACGKAVAAPRVGGIPEYLSNGDNGLLFEPENIDALKDAIERLAGDERLRLCLGREGLKTASKFPWSTPLHAYRALYREMLLGSA